MLGQDLLNYMEVLNAELQLQPGEANTGKGLAALNMAQDFFETVAAQRPKILGSTTLAPLVTTANLEFSVFPPGLLRIDSIWIQDSNSRPIYQLRPVRKSGGHWGATQWPQSLFVSTGTGKPVFYEANGTAVFWSPIPNGVYTMRVYGFSRAADITTTSTLAYDDGVGLPIATFACRLIKTGLDDDPAALTQLATDTFNPILDTLSSFQRDGASSLEYSMEHTT